MKLSRDRLPDFNIATFHDRQPGSYIQNINIIYFCCLIAVANNCISNTRYVENKNKVYNVLQINYNISNHTHYLASNLHFDNEITDLRNQSYFANQKCK